jgi:Fe-S cluster biogenesis protein NfuA
MVPLHPQPYPGAPDRLRWIAPAATLPFTGAVKSVPAPLAELLADGTLAEVFIEPGAVVTRLGDGSTWACAGPRVRTALHTALADAAGWTPSAAMGPGSDDSALRRVAQQVVEMVINPYARRHGGSASLVGVSAGVVTVRLHGSCSGCPAARWSILDRLERELRHRHPALRGVQA